MLCASTYATATAPGAAVKEEPKVSNDLKDQATQDQYVWLEDVEGKKALDWVRSENAISTKVLEALRILHP